jgi:hypothetical protein
LAAVGAAAAILIGEAEARDGLGKFVAGIGAVGENVTQPANRNWRFAAPLFRVDCRGAPARASHTANSGLVIRVNPTN